MLHAYHTSARPGARRFLPTLNLLVHRDVVAKVGVMDEALRRAQDLEWTGRMDQAGIPLWFEPGAVVVHAPERDASSLWRDYFETAKVSYHARQKLGLPAPFPRWLRSSAMVKTLSPLVALAAALSLFAHNPALLPYLYCLPGIWYTKLAWCLGAAEQMRK